MTDTITIPVPAEVARAYEAATPQMRRKMELILRFQLQTYLNHPPRGLLAAMDDLSAEAERNGLTEAELADILKEWDDERRR